MNQTINILKKLETDHNLSHDEWVKAFEGFSPETLDYLSERARKISTGIFGKSIYLRGLIEFTNYCRNDCYYCGICRSNKKADRFRLTDNEILQCCREGYDLGLRTFVLQGGEDPFYSDVHITEIISSVNRSFPDCAITLSIGERSEKAYRNFFSAGADRYLLRHETADINHYRQLHPDELTLENRKSCLWTLKNVGYQTGTGFMVGSPGQTYSSLAEDMIFIHELQPHMVGIGPFISHHDTVFADHPSGSIELTLYCIGLIRLMLPEALIPSTTALASITESGPERGILSGANVIMPNLTPEIVRSKYNLYDNIKKTGTQSADGISRLSARLDKIGYHIDFSRGDHRDFISCD